MFERFTDASRRVVVYGRHLDGCRADDGCTCGLDALLREFPEPPTTAAVPT